MFFTRSRPITVHAWNVFVFVKFCNFRGSSFSTFLVVEAGLRAARVLAFRSMNENLRVRLECQWGLPVFRRQLTKRCAQPEQWQSAVRGGFSAGIVADPCLHESSPAAGKENERRDCTCHKSWHEKIIRFSLLVFGYDGYQRNCGIEASNCNACTCVRELHFDNSYRMHRT